MVRADSRSYLMNFLLHETLLYFSQIVAQNAQNVLNNIRFRELANMITRITMQPILMIIHI